MSKMHFKKAPSSGNIFVSPVPACSVFQAEGSSFLQMGASLEQQVLCMFKVRDVLFSKKNEVVL